MMATAGQQSQQAVIKIPQLMLSQAHMVGNVTDIRHAVTAH